MSKIDTNVGVLICECGGVLRKKLDFAELRKGLDAMDAVATVETCPRLCDPKACSTSLSKLAKSSNRVVVAGCDREEFSAPLRSALQKAKINESFCWTVNIREQCAMVHDRKAATAKATDLITTAAERVKLAIAVTTKTRTLRREVIVVGGGLAAMQSALSLAHRGLKVQIIHSGSALGGFASTNPELFAHLDTNPDFATESLHRCIEKLATEIAGLPTITVHSKALLSAVDGEVGDFTVHFTTAGAPQSLHAGAVILATGFPGVSAVAASADKPALIDLAGLLARIRVGQVPARIAIVVDTTAEQGRAITGQVLSSAELLTNRFNSKVKVFFSNVRTGSEGMEPLYRRARNAGVNVVKWEQKPIISASNDKATVSSFDTAAHSNLVEEFDLVVVPDLSMTLPRTVAAILPEDFRAGPEGGLQYDNIWLLPVLTNRTGIFVAGAARANSDIRDSQQDGLAVAAQVHQLLASGRMAITSDAAFVDPDKCAACLTCLRICPHGAISIDPTRPAALVSRVSCQRCGVCAADCPARAIHLPRYSDAMVSAEVGRRPKITVFACENSALPAASASAGSPYSSDVRLVRVPCAGKVDPQMVLTALEAGSAKVLVLGCHPESCRYLTGSSRASRRMSRLLVSLEKAGFDKSRVMFGGLASVEAGRFLQYVSAK